MNKLPIIIFTIFIQIIYVNLRTAYAQNRQHLLMDFNWKFIQSDVIDAEKTGFDDKQWRILNLPHDWSIEGEFKEDAASKGAGGYLPTGIGWYRKHFSISKIQKDQNFRIEFDGVYMNSDVWINGNHLGKHPYGYTCFYYDLTPYIKKGENIIAVKVDNSIQTNSRWYSGSGIYRHVWLNVSGPVHIAQWGTYIITPEVDSASASIVVRTTIENKLPISKNIVLRSVVKNKSGKEVEVIETKVSLPPSVKTETEQILKIEFPSLWSPETPELYTLHSSVLESKKQIDVLITPFGIRKIEYDKDNGFLLNGKRLKMNGVCLHHDGGCLGAAVPEQAWRRRLQILKEMGCNAIRTSHNPVAPEFLDLCDEMGFLVMDEIFDEWIVPKGQITSGYHLWFKDYAQSDVLSMIHRDRNHPSVVLWSAGNEIGEQATENGHETLKFLIDIFHKEDPTRPVTVANDKIVADDGATTLPFLQMQDIVGYNYVDRWHERRELYYSIDRHDHPDWKMIGTENVSIPGIRGKYSIESVQTNSFFDRFLNYRTIMIRAEQLWKYTYLHNYVMGDFMWTGIDHLGEAFWPAKSSFSGVIDLCGFPKDGYYFYQSQWTNKPMVHVFPHWNWQGYEGRIIPVIVYSNCDSVELFLNDKSFGVKTLQFPQQGNSKSWRGYDRPFVSPSTSDLHLSWDVPYEPGNLKVIGKKNGITVSKERRTTSKPYAIRLSADRKEINADAQDIVNIKVEIVDENGLLVPDADVPIQFKIEGEGKIIGTDNGDQMDKTPMKSNKRNTFNGFALVVIQSTDKTGNIKLSAISDELKGDVLQIDARKPENPFITIESLK